MLTCRQFRRGFLTPGSSVVSSALNSTRLGACGTTLQTARKDVSGRSDSHPEAAECREAFRWFPIVTGLILSSALLAAASQVRAQSKERKDIEDLIKNHPQELETYKYAVELLMKNPDANKNYQYYANLHNVFTASCDHGCEHWNDLFFPWHRSLLYAFEKALQETDPPKTKDVTIPYWNWSRPHSGKRFPKAFEESGSVLCDKVVINKPGWNKFHGRRNRDESPPPYTPEAIRQLTHEITAWRDFGGGPKPQENPCFRNAVGDVEYPIHDDMHSGYIGGDMGNPERAGRDPIFWSFHCYIDVIWDRWQKEHGQPPTSLDASLRGLREKNKVRDVEKVQDLGYFYKHAERDLPVAKVNVRMENWRYQVIPLESAMQVSPNIVARWGGAGPFVFKFKVPRSGFHTAHLKIVSVKVPVTYGFSGDIYVYPASTAFKPDDGEFRKKYRHQLPFAMWQGHTHAGNHSCIETVDAYIRITPLLQRLAKSNSGEEWVVTITAKPNHPEAENGKPAPRYLPLHEEVQFSGMEIVLDRAAQLREEKRGEKEGHNEP